MFEDIMLISILYISAFMGTHHAFTLIEDQQPASLSKPWRRTYISIYFGLSALITICATKILMEFIDLAFSFKQELLSWIFLAAGSFAVYLLVYVANLIKPKPKNCS